MNYEIVFFEYQKRHGRKCPAVSAGRSDSSGFSGQRQQNRLLCLRHHPAVLWAAAAARLFHDVLSQLADTDPCDPPAAMRRFCHRTL